MAFCNSCGANLSAGATFCNKCGAAVPAAAPPAAAAPAPPAAATTAPATTGGGSSALKIILIVVAVIFGLGILGVGTVAFFIHRAVSRTHIEHRNGNVKVETPFGTVQSSDDSEEAIRNLGIDVYPGADSVKGSSASLNLGGMKTATAEFESGDSPATIAEFYRSKLPNASFNSAEGDHYTLISRTKNNLFTVNIEPRGDKTRISISKVTGKMVSGASSND